jgi:hypothetical protein
LGWCHQLYQYQIIWANDIGQGYKGNRVYVTQRHFLSRLKEGRPFETSGSEYLKSFAGAQAAYQSAQEGRMDTFASEKTKNSQKPEVK